MRAPRIQLDASSAPFEWLTATQAVRYGAAVGLGLIGWELAAFASARITTDAYLLVLFGLMMLGGVLGGFGPGLVTTLIAATGGYLASSGRLGAQDVRMLLAEGLLLSIVGGTLRSARLRARQQLSANLNLEQRILEIGDDERRRIGHDLHDGLGQHLTGISLLSETLAQQLEAGKQPDAATVETITRLVSEAVGITRDLARSLSPVTLERDGFIAAIQELADTSTTLFGINCVWEYDDEQLPLDRTRSLHLYRIIQEAVNNSVRHGKAQNVQITTRRVGGSLSITVRDDGSGLSQKTMSNPGLGLRIMEYRARMLGASLVVERCGEQRGTVVICTCPISGRPIGS